MTKFVGKKTGFNPTGSNECVPNPSGPPATKFMGRGGLPEGQLKHYPGITDDVSNGNRRLARANHGEGDGMSTRFTGRRSGFNKSGT